MEASVNEKSAADHGVSFAQALRLWIKVGLLSFGGPAGQIALMHRLIVDEKKWLGEARFLHALNYCMLLPGPEAQQLATYIGWLLHGVKGGVAAGLLFFVPGAFVMLSLSILYVTYADLPLINALFYGVKAAVLAVVVEAIFRIGRRALKTNLNLGVAAAAFIALFFFAIPFPVIVATAALIGFVAARLAPGQTGGSTHDAASTARDNEAAIDRALAAGGLAHTRPSSLRTLGSAIFWIVVWLLPVFALFALLGPENTFTTIATFFSQMAVVTFGGAYAVLAYVGQEAVETYHWLSTPEMMDGLALAETTPGPLILVLQHVGFIAAFRDSDTLDPYLAGALGALLTLWVTFVPSFLWIFAGAPYAEALRNNKALSAALATITAAVVGVILNLAVWFALHVLFARIDEVWLGPLRLYSPDFATLDIWSLALSALAMSALLRLKLGMLVVLALAGVAGIIIKLAV
jgi:chromate transporter